MKVMVIGGGGREHAVIRKLRENPDITELYALPGNAGMAGDATCVPIGAKDIASIVSFAEDNAIDYAVVTPDDPLVLGCVDALEEIGVPCFGPRSEAAQIEGSKVFAKNLMKKYGIPTARYEVFTEPEAALAYVRSCPIPIVVKADGLALGKGVVVARSREEAEDAVRESMENHKFGKSGERLVIEEFLEGPEVSVLAFTDGKTLVPMVSSMDHKCAWDGDKGPNTGGMGVYSPVPMVTPEELATMTGIMERVVRQLAKDGTQYSGCLYGGFMLTPEGPKVLEFNARFGDPETQVVLPRMHADLVEVMLACDNGTLSPDMVSWEDDWAVAVVLASAGYPGSYEKGKVITGIEQAETLPGVTVYHAGTKLLDDGTLVTSGGRVLAVTAVAATFEAARERAYEAAELIRFDGRFFRTDIGMKAIIGRENL